VPHLADCVDDIAFIPSMVSPNPTCTDSATFMQTRLCGLPGFRHIGAVYFVSAWAGLNATFPTFVVLPDTRGFAPTVGYWSAGFPARVASWTMLLPSLKTRC